MPAPTKPACAGALPDPLPEMNATFDVPESVRQTTLIGGSLSSRGSVPPQVPGKPWVASVTRVSLALALFRVSSADAIAACDKAQRVFAAILRRDPGAGPIDPVPSVCRALPLARNVCAKRVVLLQADVTQTAARYGTPEGRPFHFILHCALISAG